MGYEDLPGTVDFRVADVHAAFFIRGQAVIVGEHRFKLNGQPIIRAGWVAVPSHFIGDAPALDATIAFHADRWFRPWRYPDRPPVARFDLFPRTARLWRHVRSRLRGG